MASLSLRNSALPGSRALSSASWVRKISRSGERPLGMRSRLAAIRVSFSVACSFPASRFSLFSVLVGMPNFPANSRKLSRLTGSPSLWKSFAPLGHCASMNRKSASRSMGESPGDCRKWVNSRKCGKEERLPSMRSRADRSPRNSATASCVVAEFSVRACSNCARSSRARACNDGSASATRRASSSAVSACGSADASGLLQASDVSGRAGWSSDIAGEKKINAYIILPKIAPKCKFEGYSLAAMPFLSMKRSRTKLLPRTSI